MKKLFSVSLLFSVLFANVAFGQDSTKTAAMKPMSTGYAPLKTFGGAKQYASWSFGIAAGGLAPVSALGGLNQFSSYKIQLGYSAFIKWQIQHSFGISANYLGGEFSANSGASGQNAGAGYGAGGGQDVTSKLTYAIAIKGEVDVASIDFLRRQNAVRVFLTGGYGLASYKPSLYNESSVKAGYVPIGAGIKIKASQGLAINLGYEVMFFDASNLLGAPYITNDGRQNKASYGSLGLEYTFGTGRKPAMIWTNPVAVMYDELKSNDSLSKEVTSVKNRVTNVEGDVTNLKKDSDGDGVSDVFDKCPNTPAGTKVDGSGCELPKPEVIAPKVEIIKITDEDIKVVKEAIRNLNFATNKTTILSSSYESLDKVADLLKSKPSESLSLKGYTDNVGKASANLILSRGRANAVKDYLVSKGVDASKITAEGYGKSHPVTTNKTARGRAKNRRVEFNLF